MSWRICCTAGGKKPAPKKAAGHKKTPTKNAVTIKEEAAGAAPGGKQGGLAHRLLAVRAEAYSALLNMTEP